LLKGRSLPAALCVTTTDALFVAAASAERPGVLLTALDGTGDTLWAKLMPTATYAPGSNSSMLATMVATNQRLFIVTDLSEPSQSAGITAFDLEGRQVWHWLLTRTRASAAASSVAAALGEEVVFPLSIAARQYLPEGPEVPPGPYVLAYDGDGRLLWHHSMAGVVEDIVAAGDDLELVVGPPAARLSTAVCARGDLACQMKASASSPSKTPTTLRMTAAGSEIEQSSARVRGGPFTPGSAAPSPVGPSAPGPRCSSQGKRTANRRGELLVKLRLPFSICDNGCVQDNGRYALLDFDLHESWSRDALGPVRSFNLALGDDGSVFESGWMEREDESTAAYLARIR
jgi:hypothetical protein